ncbi:hypothetical protein GCM10022222_04660 [Amycolatopsis ultiminotia]|uniref:Secreted protein n=1 Tax=Amycolatopsis ultiminotia TaxID=543629 RepID=A0ABP6UZJ7_9PSEU
MAEPTDRRIVRRVTAGAALTATAAIALAGTAFAAADPAAGRAQDPNPVQVRTAGYPLEVRLTTPAGDGYSTVQAPGTSHGYPGPSHTWSTVSFGSNEKPVVGYAPLQPGKTFTCTAGGSAARPRVTCGY